MSYVDGFLLIVKKKELSAYRRLARQGAKLWIKHGALDFKECVGDDLATECGLAFPSLVKLKPGETVVFSFIVYKSRAHRDRVNAKAIADMAKLVPPKKMPFDMERMSHGGFRVLVDGQPRSSSPRGSRSR